MTAVGQRIDDWILRGPAVPMNGNGHVADLWPEPEPVEPALPPVPAFDVDRLLPVAFAPWARDVAERAQCPVDFVAVGVMVAAGAVVGRQLAIRPKRHDDWVAVPNLWGLAIGRPGLMKTSAMQEALRGVHRLTAEARTAHQHALGEHVFRVAEAQARRAAIDKQLKASAAKGLPTSSLREDFDAAREPTAPVERRYLVNDSTVEKLGELLNQNPNGLLLFRDELAGFLRTMEREGHQNDQSFYCEAWNGAGAYTYDRIGRGTLHIEAACVSILGGIQPMPLAAYLRDTFGAGKDDGFVQRFQLMVWPDVAPTWRNVDRWPDLDARRRVVELFLALDRLDPEALGAQRDGGALPSLQFAPEAQACFDAWRHRLELALRRDEDAPVLLSHLAKYRSLVPSVALLIHTLDALDRGVGGPVSLAATERAIAWCDFLEPHARRVYSGLLDAGRAGAAALAAKLTIGALPDPFTARAVRLKGWAGLTEPEAILGALGHLESRAWLRAEPGAPGKDGGRPTVQYHINPRVRRTGAAEPESGALATAPARDDGEIEV